MTFAANSMARSVTGSSKGPVKASANSACSTLVKLSSHCFSDPINPSSTDKRSIDVLDVWHPKSPGDTTAPAKSLSKVRRSIVFATLLLPHAERTALKRAALSLENLSLTATQCYPNPEQHVQLQTLLLVCSLQESFERRPHYNRAQVMRK